MAEIFRLLPVEQALNLNVLQRDTLLQNREYILPGGDSDETIKHELNLDEQNGYLHFDLGFTTGQNGFVSIELRKFKRSNGSILIVYSSVGGMLRAYDQQEILIFDYENAKLTLSREKLLPQTVSIREFLVTKTPDSISKKIERYVMATYNLSTSDSLTITFDLFPDVPLDETKYLVCDSMIFTWNGRTFTKRLSIEKRE